MDARGTASEQLGRLQRGIGDAKVFDGLRIFASQFELTQELGRNRCTDARGEARNLRSVRDWHQSRNDRHVDTVRARLRAELDEAIVIEEQLRDQKVGAGVDLGFEVIQVGLWALR